VLHGARKIFREMDDNRVFVKSLTHEVTPEEGEDSDEAIESEGKMTTNPTCFNESLQSRTWFHDARCSPL